MTAGMMIDDCAYNIGYTPLKKTWRSFNQNKNSVRTSQ